MCRCSSCKAWLTLVVQSLLQLPIMDQQRSIRGQSKVRSRPTLIEVQKRYIHCTLVLLGRVCSLLRDSLLRYNAGQATSHVSSSTTTTSQEAQQSMRSAVPKSYSSDGVCHLYRKSMCV